MLTFCEIPYKHQFSNNMQRLQDGANNAFGESTIFTNNVHLSMDGMTTTFAFSLFGQIKLLLWMWCDYEVDNHKVYGYHEYVDYHQCPFICMFVSQNDIYVILY